MTQNLGSSRAREEVERRRRNFYNKPSQSSAGKKKKSSGSAYSTWSSDGDSFFEFSEFSMRRMAPIAMVIHGFTILFLLSWLFSGIRFKQGNFAISMNASMPITAIQIEEPDELYRFELSQTFPSGVTPLYSELEIELRRGNQDHVYTFYKDLWQEKYADDYGYSTYSDKKMDFQILLDEPGTYYLKATSFNNNLGDISGTYYTVSSSHLYFMIYGIVFGSLSVILIVLSGKWGSPVEMLSVLPRIKSIRRNMLFWSVLSVSVVLYLFSLYASITCYGYPAGGEETVLPTPIFNKNDVYYLG